MRLRLCLLAAAAGLVAVPALADVEKPPAIVADGMPAVPDELAERTRPYMEFRTASLQGWNPARRSIAITTRFGNTRSEEHTSELQSRLHLVCRLLLEKKKKKKKSTRCT